MAPTTADQAFNIVEASLPETLGALASGSITAEQLATAHLQRTAHLSTRQGLHAMTVLNPHALDEARASDAHRRQHPDQPRPLEGIPYTIKDSYAYSGLTCTNGSPALRGLMSKRDAFLASQLRAAGAVLLGKTNMPPMAAGGMQRGLYGRAENPYNRDVLAGAFSSGSSNGAAAAVASSMGVFGLGSETVSSGRSPASNCGVVCYTGSRGVLSCRGLWPLYGTCDVPVPYARSVGDLLAVVAVVGREVPDDGGKGDFWREQPWVEIEEWSEERREGFARLLQLGVEGCKGVFKGKRIAVPKMYIGGRDSHPNVKQPEVSQEVIEVWKSAKKVLEGLGAEVIETDFPLVTRYEDDSKSGQANNVLGAPEWWNEYERKDLVACLWDAFLVDNGDERLSDLSKVDPNMLFPKPEGYVPDTYIEARNWIRYADLPALADKYRGKNVYDMPGLREAVIALEKQRKRDFEDWLAEEKLDLVVFPAQGGVGRADLETNLDSTEYALRNGIKYSNGNRAIRHLGVPTVSVPMGVLEKEAVPVNLTFAGKSGSDIELLQTAWVFDDANKARKPPGVGALQSDTIRLSSSAKAELADLTARRDSADGKIRVQISGKVVVPEGQEAPTVDVYLDGMSTKNVQVNADGTWTVSDVYQEHGQERLGWDLKPIMESEIMVLVVAGGGAAVELVLA